MTTISIEYSKNEDVTVASLRPGDVFSIRNPDDQNKLQLWMRTSDIDGKTCAVRLAPAGLGVTGMLRFFDGTELPSTVFSSMTISVVH